MSTERSAERPTPLIDALVDIAVEKFWSAESTFQGKQWKEPFSEYHAAGDVLDELKAQGIPMYDIFKKMLQETSLTPNQLCVHPSDLLALDPQAWEDVFFGLAYGILTTELQRKHPEIELEGSRRTRLSEDLDELRL